MLLARMLRQRGLAPALVPSAAAAGMHAQLPPVYTLFNSLIREKQQELAAPAWGKCARSCSNTLHAPLPQPFPCPTNQSWPPSRTALGGTAGKAGESSASDLNPSIESIAARKAWQTQQSPATVRVLQCRGAEATCVRCRLPNVSGFAAEMLCDNLLGLGAQSVVVQEHRPPGSEEQPIFEENPGSPNAPAKLWDDCEVVAYFGLEHDAARSIGLALGACGLSSYDSSAIVIEQVVNEQWVEQIKASYVPLRLSPRLCIAPEWSEPPNEPGVLNILLQPGVAFGTGEHPTTRMCLLELEAMAGTQGIRGARVMDYGAGSGVLALAALKLGAASAVGTDVDPLAVRSAKRNAELNGYDEATFRVLQCGQSLDDPDPVQVHSLPAHFDLVCANILRGPLFELAPRLLSYTRPGGMLLLSGVLEEQVTDVMAAYAPHVHDVRVALKALGRV